MQYAISRSADAWKKRARAFGFAVDEGTDEQKLFDRSCVIQATPQFHREHGNDMPSVPASEIDPKQPRLFDDYVNANWKTNVTFLDLDLEVSSKKTMHQYQSQMSSSAIALLLKKEGRMQYTESKPVIAAARIVDSTSFREVSETINKLCAFFDFAGRTPALLTHSDSRLTSEIIAGEMGDTMKQLRYGISHHRASPSLTQVRLALCFHDFSIALI